jgi:pyridoxal 5'-phosphate synthase pdxT subunit
MKIGVLALQGAFAEHAEVLNSLKIEAVPVRLPVDLKSIDALIIPGGESTTITKLMWDYQLLEPLKYLIEKGLPVFGTCAGMVLLAKKVVGPCQESLGAMDIEVKRNAFGRQVESFEVDLDVPALGKKSFRGIFIRAPLVQKVDPNVEILSKIGNSVVAVKQGKLLACSFHPELTNDLRFHKYFLTFITGDAIGKRNY